MQMDCTVFTELYPLQAGRTAEGETVAIRDLVAGARASGLRVVAVVRPLPVRRFPLRIPLPAGHRSAEPPVFDIPKIFRGSGTGTAAMRLATRSSERLDWIRSAKVAVCHMVDGFLLARSVMYASARLVLVVHASDLRRRELPDCLARADQVLCRSSSLRIRLHQQTGRLADGVAFSGVPESDFAWNRHWQPADRLRVVSACILVPLKNMGSVLRALKLMEHRVPFEFDLYGDGPLKDELNALASSLALRDRVRFHGFRPRQEVLEHMRDCDVFVMPSAPETLGLGYLEAMAQQCVVLGHKEWGIDGIVEDGVSGLLVNDASPEEIAGKLIEYWDGDRGSMHRRSFQTVTAFTADAAARNYAELISASAFPR